MAEKTKTYLILCRVYHYLLASRLRQILIGQKSITPIHGGHEKSNSKTYKTNEVKLVEIAPDDKMAYFIPLEGEDGG